ncbi:MAG: hypothetical protein GY703_03175 [Gammaproteobacteria bacterium]|nr:hypothetical protein [Gammaproteobacteria bacterium]
MDLSSTGFVKFSSVIETVLWEKPQDKCGCVIGPVATTCPSAAANEWQST